MLDRGKDQQDVAAPGCLQCRAGLIPARVHDLGAIDLRLLVAGHGSQEEPRVEADLDLGRRYPTGKRNEIVGSGDPDPGLLVALPQGRRPDGHIALALAGIYGPTGEDPGTPHEPGLR